MGSLQLDRHTPPPPLQPRSRGRGHRRARHVVAGRRPRRLGPPRRPGHHPGQLVNFAAVRAGGQFGCAVRGWRLHRGGRRSARGAESQRGTAAAGTRSARRRSGSRTVASWPSPWTTTTGSSPVAASTTRGGTRTPTPSRSGTARPGSRSATTTVPGPAFVGNVTSLQILGDTLYVGGEFQNGAGIPPPPTTSRLRPFPAAPRAPPSPIRTTPSRARCMR